MEVGDDALGHYLADTLNLLQFLKACIHQRIDILEMARQQLSRRLAHKTDAEGEDHTLERHLFRGGDTIHNPLGRLGARAIAINLLHIDVVEIGNVMDESLTEVIVDGLRAEGVDVHSFAGDEVLDAPLDLWRTTRIIGTIPGGLALIAYEGCAALRTALDELHRLGDDGTLIDINTHDLGDDFATLFYVDIIADVEVERADKVFIVERGALHGGACQLHRIHIGHRGDGTRTAHLISDLIQSGANAFGLELISNSPAGTLGRKAQGALLS